MAYSESVNSSKSEHWLFMVSYSESVNSSKSESKPESDSSSALMNLDICISFILCLHSSK